MKSVREYKYRVNFISVNDEIETENKALNFEIANHDNLFKLLALIQGKLNLTPPEEQAFLLGLKMFSEILIKNRHDPLFRQMKQPMGEIMALLKGHIKKAL
jgi:hypothetical protein